jgi:glycosyltransferase involved in cell wall biosynthesis
MVIAIDMRFAEKRLPAGEDSWVFRQFAQLALAYPQHQFVCIGSLPWPAHRFAQPNMVPVTAGPPAYRYRLLQYWYNLRLPALLRKYKVSVFVTQGFHISLYAKLPQCLLVNSLPGSLPGHPLPKAQAGFYKTNLPRFFNKAERILATTQTCADALDQAFPGGAGKVRVLRPGVASLFCPTSYQQQEAVRERYAKGRAYFLYVGDLLPQYNLMNLLKAFSQFKKMQQSNMQLLLAGHDLWPKNELVQSLRSYKYRRDVVLTGWLPPAEMAGVMAAAYGLVQPAELPGFSLPPLEAMCCGVPVIMPATASLTEIGGPAALYAADGSVQQLATQMMLLFKNEDLRNEKIAAGLQWATGQAQPPAMHQLAQAIFGAAENANPTLG